MILNYRTINGYEEEYAGASVFVDGVKIPLVWYVDTDAGIVKTYDVDETHQLVVDETGIHPKSRTITGTVTVTRPPRKGAWSSQEMAGGLEDSMTVELTEDDCDTILLWCLISLRETWNTSANKDALCKWNLLLAKINRGPACKHGNLSSQCT